MTGTLYLVSVPMGNRDELSPRAIQILGAADVLVCEEWKGGRTLMKQLGLTQELLRLNEHDREQSTPELLALLKSGKTLALFSDSGAPVFSDPGADLVRLCYRNQVAVRHVSGASSLVSALVVCGFSLDQFLYLGWLPRNAEEREAALAPLKNEWRTAIVMDTPYRLLALLESVHKVLGPQRAIAVCCDLTAEQEQVRRGSCATILDHFRKHPQKPEFVLVIGGCRETL